MRVRARRNGDPASWRRSLALSVVLHALALGVIAVGAGAVARDDAATGRGHWAFGLPAPAAEPEAPTLVDLAAADTVLPAALTTVAAVAPPEDLAAARAGDQANPVPESAAHRDDGTQVRHAPAPDHGAGAGRPVPDRAWRRDASTLHERLTDGAELNQSSHARVAATAASFQAVRREPKVGEGDATRTLHHVPTATAPAYELADPNLRGAGAEAMPGAGDRAARAPSTTTASPQPERMSATSSQGPLDADRGRRSFDVEARGAVAADDRATRAASNESHPSITDLTLAVVSGNTGEGRGLSDTPGATSRVSQGTAPAPVGVRSASDGVSEEMRARERLYNRYIQDIGARVNRALIWPRALAIRLEQGETVVRFVVLPDGRVGDGIHVVKSSGFAEFDKAAVDAVGKASPFPPMREPTRSRPLSINLPVNFSNPVIR